MNKEPVVEKELVEYLETVFPLRYPESYWSEREIFEYAGCLKVVNHLRSKLEEQERQHEETILTFNQ